MMMKNWSAGMEELRKISSKNHELDFTLAEALEIQIRSTHNILKFYQFREMLLNSDPCCKSILASPLGRLRTKSSNASR